MNSREGSLTRLLGVVVVFLFAVYGCRSGNAPVSGDQKDFNSSELQNNVLMQQFATNHPEFTILKYAQADLNNDARADLIVIYRLTAEKNMMCIVHQHGSAVTETNSVPAPVSDQMIQFRNIDDAPPLEFILQGRKGAKVGYAIFRLEAGKLSDLFGEGMEDCC